MSRTTAMTRNRQLLAAIVAFALVSVFVIRTSDAAFTVTTDNKDNLFTTGQLSLVTDLNGVPLFGDTDEGAVLTAANNAINLAQGDVVTGCIEITYEGTFDGQLTQVSLAVDGVDEADELADYLDVDIELVDDCSAEAGASFASDTLSALAGGTFNTGWTPSGDEDSQVYRFTVEVTGEDNAAMNLTAEGVNLTWSVSTTS